MLISRRTFLAASGGCCLGMFSSAKSKICWPANVDSVPINSACTPPAFSIIPVIGDGKWIWRDPPPEEGYLEPREFAVTVGMQFTASGDSTELYGTTVAPSELPEQKVLDSKIETSNCEARLEQLADGATQLQLYAPALADGMQAEAWAQFRLKVFKSHFGFDKTKFPQVQKAIRGSGKIFTGNSPGIKATSSQVKRLVKSLTDSTDSEVHPWDLAYQFYRWVWKHIKGRPGKYTSVEAAIKSGVGDCEERACTFIAMCRAAGIPARQVWVPSHVWAEIALHDHDGIWHWIPVHTAAYNWFGWTGAHEIVLQKGDKIRPQGRTSSIRLLDDWYRIKGPRPKTQFTCEIKPIAAEGDEPGPGARKKLPDGQWQLLDAADYRRFVRDR